jgi:hypothetical protein
MRARTQALFVCLGSTSTAVMNFNAIAEISVAAQQNNAATVGINTL